MVAGALEDGVVRVGRHLVIPVEELEWRFSGSGGPGGQHANTANTRVELVFDIQRSAVLGPRQRTRLGERFGAVVRVVVSSSRSQARNRQLALERLSVRLEEALRTERPRRPTEPSERSRQRRLQQKHERAELKRQRSTSALDRDS